MTDTLTKQTGPRAQRHGTLQPDGSYEYEIGMINGRKVTVASFNPTLCRFSLNTFYQDALRASKTTSTQERLRAKLRARTKA